MTSTLTLWIACAVLLFWAVGAYNRLVRLRGEANAAFGLLEGELVNQVRLVEECLPHDRDPADTGAQESTVWTALHAAAHQLQASLALARHKPLAPDGIAALGAAQEVLAMAWERAERADAHDLAGPRLPPTITTTRTQLVAQGTAMAMQFNQAVERYNHSIGQFPAILLAWLFGFKPGRGLRQDA